MNKDQNKFENQSFLGKTNKVSTSTNINEPSHNHQIYSKKDDLNPDPSFPLIEIETADSFWNSENGNRSQLSLLNDSEFHQRHSSNIFDSSASAIFDESEIDIENASFVSEISALAFSTNNQSSLQSPYTNQKGLKKKMKNVDNPSFSTGKNEKKKKKTKHKPTLEDVFIFNLPGHFIDYFQSYDDALMPPVLSRRWKKKPLSLRKEVVCAYRAEDSRFLSKNIGDTEQKLREDEEMRRERVVEYSILHGTDKLASIYDDKDEEIEHTQTQPPSSHELDANDKIDQLSLHHLCERNNKIDNHELESMKDSLNTEKKVNILLILSLAIRFMFYIGHLLNIC